jgi:hypothetical protein
MSAAPSSVHVAREERRREPRLAAKLPVTLTFRDGAAAWTEADSELIDVSRGGMFVRSDRLPRAGDAIVLRLTAPVEGRCAAAGSAVRTDPRGGFGMQFDRISPELARLVRELARAEPGARSATLAALGPIEIVVARRSA